MVGKPLVSVVIPLYNKKQYIQRAIDSVLRQSYANFEIVVIDDGSTDSSPEIVRSIADPRICLFVQQNAGEGMTRDRGIREASGEYIALLDADDEWLPGFIESGLKLFMDFPEIGAAGLGYASCMPDGELIPTKVKTPRPAPWRGVLPDYFSAALESSPLWSSSTMLSRKAFYEVNPKASKARLGADLYLWCQIALKYPIAYDSEVMAIYHIDADNRVCNAVWYDGELPAVTFLKGELAAGRIERSRVVAIRDYISHYQLSSIWFVLRYTEDFPLVRRLLSECLVTRRYYLRWIRYWVEGNTPAKLLHFWLMLGRKMKALLHIGKRR